MKENLKAVRRDVEELKKAAIKNPLLNQRGEEAYDWNQGYDSALRKVLALLVARDEQEKG